MFKNFFDNLDANLNLLLQQAKREAENHPVNEDIEELKLMFDKELQKKSHNSRRNKKITRKIKFLLVSDQEKALSFFIFGLSLEEQMIFYLSLSSLEKKYLKMVWKDNKELHNLLELFDRQNNIENESKS